MNILIAIHGSHSQPEQMQAQRETWLRDVMERPYPEENDHVVDYRFFLGGDTNAEDWDVVATGTPDGPKYYDKECFFRTPVLNQKTHALAKYALENEYDYVFKCDDDTYVRVAALLKSGFENYPYSGSVERHYAPDLGFYDWCQGGAGYWLCRPAMALIAEHGLHLVPAEDFAVGQLLARHNIRPHHDARYVPTAKPERSDWITTHKIGAEKMRALYRAQ